MDGSRTALAAAALFVYENANECKLSLTAARKLELSGFHLKKSLL